MDRQTDDENQIQKLSNALRKSIAKDKKTPEELNKRLEDLEGDQKSLTTVIQRFIDEHMQDKIIILKTKYKDFESKIDTLEWLSRYANFYSPENVY